MHDSLQRRQVVTTTRRFRQLQHAAEHRRHELAVRDPIPLHQLQVLLGIEVLHDHHGSAVADDQGHVGLRRRVIERRRRKVEHALAALPQRIEKAEQRQRLRRRVLWQWPQDAFRAARRAGRVQHRRAQPFVGNRRSGVGRCGAGEVDEPPVVHCLSVVAAVDDEAALHPRATRHRFPCHRQLGGGGDQQARFAVVDDIGQFFGGQVRVDARVVEARPLAGSVAFDVAVVVLHEDRVVVEPPQAFGPQQVGQAVGARLELGIGHRLARAGHDEGGPVRMSVIAVSGIHVRSPGVAVRGSYDRSRGDESVQARVAASGRTRARGASERSP